MHLCLAESGIKHPEFSASSYFRLRLALKLSLNCSQCLISVRKMKIIFTKLCQMGVSCCTHMSKRLLALLFRDLWKTSVHISNGVL